jgi:hypothetical protein
MVGLGTGFSMIGRTGMATFGEVRISIVFTTSGDGTWSTCLEYCSEVIAENRRNCRCGGMAG